MGLQWLQVTKLGKYSFILQELQLQVVDFPTNFF